MVPLVRVPWAGGALVVHAAYAHLNGTPFPGLHVYPAIHRKIRPRDLEVKGRWRTARLVIPVVEFELDSPHRYCRHMEVMRSERDLVKILKETPWLAASPMLWGGDFPDDALDRVRDAHRRRGRGRPLNILQSSLMVATTLMLEGLEGRALSDERSSLDASRRQLRIGVEKRRRRDIGPVWVPDIRSPLCPSDGNADPLGDLLQWVRGPRCEQMLRLLEVVRGNEDLGPWTVEDFVDRRSHPFVVARWSNHSRRLVEPEREAIEECALSHEELYGGRPDLSPFPRRAPTVFCAWFAEDPQQYLVDIEEEGNWFEADDHVELVYAAILEPGSPAIYSWTGSRFASGTKSPNLA